MNHVKAFRLTGGMTQRELAEKAGVSRRTITCLETNPDHQCHNPTKRKILIGLGVPFSSRLLVFPLPKSSGDGKGVMKVNKSTDELVRKAADQIIYRAQYGKGSLTTGNVVDDIRTHLADALEDVERLRAAIDSARGVGGLS
jgi:DNA-binding XRE family transcriptional regulator